MARGFELLSDDIGVLCLFNELPLSVRSFLLGEGEVRLVTILLEESEAFLDYRSAKIALFVGQLTTYLSDIFLAYAFAAIPKFTYSATV